MKTNWFKRTLSVILAFVLVLGYLPVTAQAQDGQEASVSNDVTLEGETSFGNLLTNTVNESQTPEADANYDGRICDLVIEGTTATVEYATPVEANLVVAIYDQDSGKMLGSGTVAVSPEETIAEVAIEIPAMPYYFRAGAFLLDAATNDPVSEEFKTDRYTKVMQDILAATVDDFNEELVLNLDDDRTTNFAVFNENTLLAKEGEDTNIVTGGNGTYTITNADEGFLSMQPGDTFAYTYEDGTVLIVNAASVNVAGSTVTVTENPDADLSTVFDFVKIEEDSFGAEVALSDEELEDGITFLQDEISPDGFSGSPDVFSISHKYFFDKTQGHGSIKGSISFSATVNLNLYIEKSYKKVELTTKYKVETDFGLNGKWEVPIVKLKGFSFRMLMGAVKVKLTPKLYLEFEIDAKFQLTMEGRIGAGYDSDYGYYDASSAPSAKSELKVEGTIYLGLGLDTDVIGLVDKLIDITFKGTIGAEVSLHPELPVFSAPGAEYHECISCFTGDVVFKFELGMDVKVFNKSIVDKKTGDKSQNGTSSGFNILATKIKIADFYYSVSFNQFGFGKTCPFRQYATTVSLLLHEGKKSTPIADVSMRLFEKDGDEIESVYMLSPDTKLIKGSVPETNDKGQSVFYLPNGQYELKVERDGEDFSKDFTVKNSSKQVKFVIEQSDNTKRLTLSDSSISLSPSESRQLTASFDGKDVTSSCVWSSGNAKVATISSGGEITAIAPGTTTVTVKYSNAGVTYEATCSVSVTQIGTVILSGPCGANGDNVTYTLTDDGTLTISGSGAMMDCSWDSDAPWYDKSSQIKTVSIEQGVTSIGDWAFSFCSSLTSVTIPNSVTSIGDHAFSWCSSLTSVTIPNSVTSIGEYAFFWCSSLTSVTIPNSVTFIGIAAFPGCSRLTDINVDPDNKDWCSVDGVLFSKDRKTLAAFPGGRTGEYQCPDGVTSIGYEAFSHCSSLTSVTIPDSVTSIGYGAFSDCISLTSLTIPSSVTSIGDEAFSHCSSLTDINVDPNNKDWCSVDGVLFSKDRKTLAAFPGGRTGEYQCPDGVTSIGYCAFYCSSLTSVTIPNSVTSIGGYAFSYCSSLTSVTIPNSVTSIGYRAFYGCSSLKDVYYGGTEEQWNQIAIGGANSALTNATIHYNSSGPEAQDGTADPADEAVPEATEETIPETIEETVPDVTEETLLEIIEEPEVIPEADGESLLLEEVADIQWYAAPAGAKMTVEPVLQELSAFTGAESGKNGLRSVKFTGLEPGEEYVLIVSLIPGSLVPENLLYIDQDNANPDGTLSFTYLPRLDVSAQVELYGIPAGRTVILDREYLTMEVGSADQKLTAAVTPEEWAGDLKWSAENPKNTQVISVNEFGDVTPIAPGTAYAVATVTHGSYEFSARCRVDVTEKQANQEVTGVQLGTTALTTELLRTDYAEFDVILLLAQNRNPEVTPDTIAPEGAMEDNGVAITSAKFADEKTAAVFDLVVRDDRTLLVVPKETAIKNPKPVAGKYVSKVIVNVGGKEFVTDASLTLTVKKSTPKLKAAALTFNPFYTGQSQAIKITGATVTDIESKTLPTWLTLENGVLTLTEKAPAKASGKVSVTVKTAEWGDNISTNLTIPVKTAYAAPKLKLSATSVTVAAKNSQGIFLKLLCGTKTDTLETLNVEDIQVDGFRVKDFDRTDGSFTLIPSGENFAGPHPGTVSFSDTRQTVPLSLKVTAKAPSIAAKPASVTLNSTAGDSARIPITASPADYRIPEVTLFLTDSRGNKLEQQDWLNFWYENGVVTVETVMDKTQPGATYYLHVSTADTRDAVITVKTLAASKSTITASAKVSGGIDLSFPASAAVVKPAFKNYASGGFTVTNWDVTEYAGKTAVGSVRDSFTLGKEDGLLVFRADSKNPPVQGHTYSLTATLTLDNGRSLTLNNLKLPVKRTPVKLKLSRTSLSLNRKIGDTAVVDVTCLTKGYDFTQPIAQLVLPSSKDGQDIHLNVPGSQEPLMISWSDGTLAVTANATAEAGKTYKVVLQATEKDPAVTLSVKILNAPVTASLKASGAIDVVRNSTAITVTPAYKNYMGLADISPELTVESGNGKTYKEVDAGLFSIVHNENGTFTITKVPGAEVDTSLKYRAKLTFNGGAKPAYVNLAVKSGTAKVVASNSIVLYKTDRFSRGTFRLTTADKALNSIVKAEIKDAKYRNLFAIHSYGNGEFALGYKDNLIPAGKLPTSVALNVFCDGSDKPVATVTLKLQVR